MSTEDLNVETSAPIGVYRTPNRQPIFDEKNASLTRTGEPVVADGQVVIGGQGEPTNHGG